MELLDLLKRGYRLYIAYGVFMAAAEMKQYCPSAIFLGGSVFNNFRLTFHMIGDSTVENIIPCACARTYAALWCIPMDEEVQLDGVFNHRFLYSKMRCAITYGDDEYAAYTYVLNHYLPTTLPNETVKKTMKEGYSDCKIPIKEWDSRFF